MSSIRGIVLSGTGFLADAYDLFVVNMVVDIMSKVPYQQVLTDELKSTVKTTALIGAIVGQLGFGAVADLIGRRVVFIVTCLLVILGAILSSTVLDIAGPFGIYSQLCLWRFLLGVGVGGEYPLSASISSESTDSRRKAKHLAIVFSMQGCGSLLCSLVLVIVTNIQTLSYDIQWRLALGVGGLPMLVAFYFRWNMQETAAWSRQNVSASKGNFADIDSLPAAEDGGDAQFLTSDGNRNGNPATISGYFAAGTRAVMQTVWENRIRLLGTAGAWFILDVVFYANSLFSGQITKAMNTNKSLRGEALSQLLLQSLALPGYIATILFVETIGLRRLQLMGFALTALFFFLLACLQPFLTKMPALYIFMYGLTFFFQNFGANATTYIVPAVVFPVHQKATCHGISAAAGKLGAIFGAQTFVYLQNSFCPQAKCKSYGRPDAAMQQKVDDGLRLTFLVCGIFALLGLVWSQFLVKTDDDALLPDSEADLEPRLGLEFEPSVAVCDKPVSAIHQLVSGDDDYDDNDDDGFDLAADDNGSESRQSNEWIERSGGVGGGGGGGGTRWGGNAALDRSTNGFDADPEFQGLVYKCNESRAGLDITPGVCEASSTTHPSDRVVYPEVSCSTLVQMNT